MKMMTLRMMVLAAAMWLAGTVGAHAQTTGGNGNGHITGNEEKKGITDAHTLLLACTIESGNENKLYQLQADLVVTAIIDVEVCMKLDLNGHTITSSANSCFDINENATLTIVDSKPGGKIGSVISNKEAGGSAIDIYSGSVLNADGVTITCASGFAINNLSGTANLTGCTLNGVYGIYNDGTASITGGSISGTDTAIKNDGGALSVNAGENPAACNLSGGAWGISNSFDGSVTLGSGVSVNTCNTGGILNDEGTVTLHAWPAFGQGSKANASDILLYPGQMITIGSAITAAPAAKIRVRITDFNANDLAADALPATFTSGYGQYVKTGDIVTDPASVFASYDASLPYKVGLNADGEASISAEQSFAFAEGQTWMTWCDKYAWGKPGGIDAYEFNGVTPATITVAPLVGDVLPAYTPLLLMKNGADGLTAKFAAAPDAPASGYDAATGTVSQTFNGATVFGATEDVDVSGAVKLINGASSYVLKGGEFVQLGYIYGFARNRCWLGLSAPAGARSLAVVKGDATGMSSVKDIGEAAGDSWYTATGRRLERRPVRKGIYIRGGQKMIIR